MSMVTLRWAVASALLWTFAREAKESSDGILDELAGPRTIPPDPVRALGSKYGTPDPGPARSLTSHRHSLGLEGSGHVAVASDFAADHRGVGYVGIAYQWDIFPSD